MVIRTKLNIPGKKEIEIIETINTLKKSKKDIEERIEDCRKEVNEKNNKVQLLMNDKKGYKNLCALCEKLKALQWCMRNLSTLRTDAIPTEMIQTTNSDSLAPWEKLPGAIAYYLGMKCSDEVYLIYIAKLLLNECWSGLYTSPKTSKAIRKYIQTYAFQEAVNGHNNHYLSIELTERIRELKKETKSGFYEGIIKKNNKELNEQLQKYNEEIKKIDQDIKLLNGYGCGDNKETFINNIMANNANNEESEKSPQKSQQQIDVIIDSTIYSNRVAGLSYAFFYQRTVQQEQNEQQGSLDNSQLLPSGYSNNN